MVVLFFVVGSEVLECLGAVVCGSFDPVTLTKLWQAGALELVFEGYIAGKVAKVYHKITPKGDYSHREDRNLSKNSEEL